MGSQSKLTKARTGSPWHTCVRARVHFQLSALTLLCTTCHQKANVHCVDLAKEPLYPLWWTVFSESGVAELLMMHLM